MAETDLTGALPIQTHTRPVAERVALGRELRAVCPHVRRVQKRDGVLRHWEYEGIRLNPNKTTHQAPQQSNIPLR